MIKATEETFPKKRKPKHPWWDSNCNEALDQRLSAWKKWNSHKTENNFDEFKQVRKNTSKIIRNAKRQYEKQQLDSIEENFKRCNTAAWYKTFNQKIQGYQAPCLNFLRNNKTLAANNAENCEILAEYFETLLNCQKPILTLSFTQPETPPTPSTPPTQGEITNIIKNLKNRKACGEDTITAEMLKLGGETAIEELHKELEQVWETKKIPNHWKTSLIHPLFKKGDKKDVNNYRGISLLPVPYKILSKSLLNRVSPIMEERLGEYQAGFRPGRSCAEQIFNLKTTVNYLSARNKKFFITFIDFKKAYDSIDRETLFKTLREYRIDETTITIIQETLTNTTSKVKFQGEISRSFQVKTGVRQGDGLSPMLFNCVLDKVIVEWRKLTQQHGVESIQIGGKRRGAIETNCFAFADDLACFAYTEEDTIKQIELLKETAEKTGLQISFEKTKILTNVKNPPKKIKTKYGKIQVSKSFKYLGELIQLGAKGHLTCKTRIQKLETAAHYSRQMYSKKCISKKTKLRHYQTVIRPQILYSSETLANLTYAEELENRERRILRTILGPRKITDNQDKPVFRLRSNKEVYTNCSKITDEIRKRRCAFYAHIMRMNPNRLTKQIFTYIANLKNKNLWFINTEKDLKEIEIDQETIQNRNLFRKKLHSFTSFGAKTKKTQGTKWTEERKAAFSARMKEVWVERKKTIQKRKK